MSRALTYADFRRTGQQDCANVFDVTDFDLSSGDAEVAFDSFDWDGGRAEWIAQQDDLEGLDPEKAHRAWLAGWKSCALPRLQRAIDDVAALRADDDSDYDDLQPVPRRNPAARKPKAAAGSSTRAQRVVTTLGRDPAFPSISVTSSSDVVKALRTLIGARASEYFAILFINPRNMVLGYDLYTMGSPSSVAVNPQGILASALGVNASAIITAHNHPSGSNQPSPDDRALWSRLREACALIGIGLLDNLVVTDNNTYYSEADGG